VVGTYGYMPMEQMMGRACAASDLYALGMTLIYLLSHMNPENFPLKNMKIMYKQFVSISSRYLTFVDKLIEPDPARRLPDAKNALSLLTRLKQGAVAAADRYEAVIDLHNLLPPFKSKIRFETRDEVLTITIPGKILKFLPLAGLSVFWFSFIALWTMLVFQIPGVFSIFFGLFSLPFWLVGLFLIGKTINGFSRALVTLSPESVSIKRGILRSLVTVPLEHVQKITTKETRTTIQGRNNSPGQALTYGVELEAGAKSIVLDKFLTQSEAQWIAQVVEKYKQLNT
jgi:serine/threonine protein kinase